LAHDTTHEEVRAGIESVGLDRHQKVVYYELDFVPGYMFWEGAARYSVWGGLGLILCDHARSRAYSQSPRQSRYYEPYEAIHAMRAQIMADAGEATSGDGDRSRRSGTQDGSSSELDRLRRLLADTESELARTQRALEIAYNSRSWKLTAPARAAAQIMRERRGAGT
jgi:hypothetical protein